LKEKKVKLSSRAPARHSHSCPTSHSGGLAGVEESL